MQEIQEFNQQLVKQRRSSSILIGILLASGFIASVPMFSDSTVVLVRSKVFDATGKRLALEQVGILDTYVANPDPILNIVPQRPYAAAYRWWEPYEFVPLIQSEIRSKGMAEPVRFVQEQIGVVTRDGAQLESP